MSNAPRTRLKVVYVNGNCVLFLVYLLASGVEKKSRFNLNC